MSSTERRSTPTIEVYTFANKEDEESGYSTMDFAEAQKHAKANRLRVIATRYEFAATETIADHTGPPDTRRRAVELEPGDVIAPPAHERRWLWQDGVRRMLTVIEIRAGTRDRRGAWMEITARYATPVSAPGAETIGVFRMRPETRIAIERGP